MLTINLEKGEPGHFIVWSLKLVRIVFQKNIVKCSVTVYQHVTQQKARNMMTSYLRQYYRNISTGWKKSVPRIAV